MHSWLWVQTHSPGGYESYPEDALHEHRLTDDELGVQEGNDCRIVPVQQTWAGGLISPICW